MDSSTTKQQKQGSSSNGNGKKKATIHQSKRQRRAAGPNPTNTWQQQPKIKSASARAKGYINYAGLADEQNYSIINNNNNNKSSNNNSNNKATMTTATSLLDPQLELDSPEIKFGRLLGGTDQRSRHGAVKMLRAYLSSRADFTLGGMGLSELDLLKLWKVRERRREGMRVYMIMYFYIGRHFSQTIYIYIYILCIFAFSTPHKINRDCGTHYTWPIRHPCKTNYRKYLLN